MAKLRGEPFSVEHFRDWCERLTLSNGERFRLEDFQAEFVGDVFEGRTENWLVVGEGNGKTTLIALLVLYHIRFRREGWVPVAAAARDQAGILYRQAAGFVLRNPAIRSEFRCFPGYRRISCLEMLSSIQIFAADAGTADGVIPTMAVIEEPHRHKNLDLYRTWAGKLDKEPGAQLVAISTAGEPGGEFEETREAFRQSAVSVERRGCFVRAVGPDSVLHEWAVPEDGDVEDLALVKAANPFSGVTVESLERKRARPSWSLPHWRRFVCNLPTRATSAAITEVEWAAARSAREIPAGAEIYLGLDVGWRWDTTALTPLWWESESFRLFGPAVVIEPPRDGSSLSPDEIKRALTEFRERYRIRALVMDSSEAEDVAAWASDELGLEVVDRGQTNPFKVGDYNALMKGLRGATLFHSGDAALTSHAMNATVRLLPGGESRFERPNPNRRSGEQVRRVIDALDAAGMAVSFAEEDRAAGDGWEPMGGYR